MSIRKWLTGKSDAEQRVDELTAHVHQLRNEMHALEAKIAENRRLGLSTSAYESMYVETRRMYEEARVMWQEALAAWKAEG